MEFILLAFYLFQLGGNFTNSTDANFTAFNITSINSTTFSSPDVAAVPTILVTLITNPVNSVQGLLVKYGYTAITMMVTLEGLSVPIPSEVVLPAAGLMAKKGYMNFGLVYLLILAANLFGLIVDYYIGYYLGREFFYKHLKLLKLSEKQVKEFEKSFNDNAQLSVFVTRLLPVVRTVASYVAGFAKMPMRQYLYFSMSGIAIWTFMLMLFGYYLISSSNTSLIIASIAVLAIVLYIGHRVVKKIMGETPKKSG